MIDTVSWKTLDEELPAFNTPFVAAYKDSKGNKATILTIRDITTGDFREEYTGRKLLPPQLWTHFPEIDHDELH